MKHNINLLLVVFLFAASALCAQNKPTIAVLGLDPAGISKSEAQVLSNRIRSLLVNTSYFRVLERANMESILTEQGFQQSGCTSDDCLVEAGQLLGVQKMLAGSVGKFGTVYTIELRIIDVESGKIESSSSYDYRGEMENLLLEGAPVALTGLIQKDRAAAARGNALYGYLLVETDVAEADIVVDGQPTAKGQSGLLRLPTGTHRLTVRHEFYIPFDDEVTLTTGDTLIRRLQLMHAQGFLTLHGEPDKADYQVAGLTGKVSGSGRLRIPAGNHALEVFSPYYYPFEQELFIKGDTTVAVHFDLINGTSDLQNRQDWHQRLLWGSVASAGLTIAAALLANMYYGKYKAAETSNQAADYKNLTQTFDQATKILSGITVTFSIVTLWNWIKTNNLKKELHVPR